MRIRQSGGNRAKQVGKSGEKRGPPRAEPDLPRCDAILFLMVNRHTAYFRSYQNLVFNSVFVVFSLIQAVAS